MRSKAWVDRCALSMSGACFVHCLCSSFLLILFSAQGVGMLGGEWVHDVGFIIAVPLSALSLWRGVRHPNRWRILIPGGVGICFLTAGLLATHGFWPELVLSALGVAFLSLSHYSSMRSRMCA